MLSIRGLSYYCFVLIILTALSDAFFLEELKSMNYEVDISNVPVKREESSQSVIQIRSQTGQEFQCIVPQFTEEDLTEKEVTTEDEQDVLSLLKPMKNGPCLTKGKDWWTYEFCFGHYIKQYHVEDGRIVGQVITLGLYDSDFDWSNTTSQEKFKHTKQKYHSQYYTNGSKCDITGAPRTAEVRLYCEEDAGDYIYRVDEPGTCSYVLIVHTSRLCSHPQLKPLPSQRAHTVVCNPSLTEEQFSSYLQRQGRKKAKAEKERNQWLDNQQKRLQDLKTENGNNEEKAEATESVADEKVPPPTKDNENVYQYVGESQNIVMIGKAPPKNAKEAMEEVSKILKDVSEMDKQMKEAEEMVQKIRRYESNFFPKKETKQENSEEPDKTDKVTEKAKKTSPDPEDSNTLHVQVRKLESKSADSDEKKEIDSEHRKKLEQAVKEKLEMAGLDTGGRRIEVKIITAGPFDGQTTKDFSPLSDEESEQFQSMIVALLTGEQDAIEEIKRHHKLEENYQFTWDEEESEKEES